MNPQARGNPTAPPAAHIPLWQRSLPPHRRRSSSLHDTLLPGIHGRALARLSGRRDVPDQGRDPQAPPRRHHHPDAGGQCAHLPAPPQSTASDPDRTRRSLGLPVHLHHRRRAPPSCVGRTRGPSRCPGLGPDLNSTLSSRTTRIRRDCAPHVSTAFQTSSVLTRAPHLSEVCERAHYSAAPAASSERRCSRPEPDRGRPDRGRGRCVRGDR